MFKRESPIKYLSMPVYVCFSNIPHISINGTTNCEWPKALK